MNILTTIANSLQASIVNIKARNERIKSINSALIAAANRHPDFRDVLFDQNFLSNQASYLIEPFLNGGALPTADSLAAAWAEQLPAIGQSRARAIANVTPMVEDFIYLLGSSTFSHDTATSAASMTAQPALSSQKHALSGI